MNRADILIPVAKELEAVRAVLCGMAAENEDIPAGRALAYHFLLPGKLLRPSLLLLSAAVADPAEFALRKPMVVKAAAAVELIHNASLIHDDIVDDELMRRGQPTLNKIYGGKNAVLVGNALVARAFSILLAHFPSAAVSKTANVIRRMSRSEIGQLGNGPKNGTHAEYLKLINGKTALLMRLACELGASALTDDADTIAALSAFGENFGMVYQIVDDCIDGDPVAARYITLDDASVYSARAEGCLYGFESSAYKSALLGMLQYVMSRTHFETEERMLMKGIRG